MSRISDPQNSSIGVDEPLEIVQSEKATQVVTENQVVGGPSKPEEPGASHDSHKDEDYEERTISYRRGGFHPVYVGDVYNDRYTILRKIGYGRYSTVWLVRDLTQLFVCSMMPLPCPFTYAFH